MSKKTFWGPSNVTRPTILDMYQKIKNEADPVDSMSTYP